MLVRVHYSDCCCCSRTKSAPDKNPAVAVAAEIVPLRMHLLQVGRMARTDLGSVGRSNLDLEAAENKSVHLH